MEKKIEPFKIRVNSEQAKVVRERMSPYLILDNVPDDYDFNKSDKSCLHYYKDILAHFYDIDGINAPEISFEDFLNMFPETREGRKVKGYKLKKDFKIKLGLVSKALEVNPSEIADNNTLLQSHWAVDTAKHLRVLNIWFDPVYEEEKPEKKAFTIGTRTWIGEKGSGQVLSGSEATTIEEIETVILEEEARIIKKKEEVETLKEMIKFIKK